MVDPRTSLALVRRDGREHLLLIGPGGAVVLEQGIIQDEQDRSAALERADANLRAREEAVARLQLNAQRLSVMGKRALEVGRVGLERWRGRRFARLLTEEPRLAAASTKPLRRNGSRRGRRS